MDLFEAWAHISFQAGQFGFLVIVVNRLLSFFPCLLAFGQQGIPEPAQLFQLLRQQAFLAFGRIEAVLERLEHGQALTPFWLATLAFFFTDRAGGTPVRAAFHPLI